MTVAIRPTQKKEVDLIELVMKETGIKTASGSLMYAGQSFIDQRKTIETQRKEIEKLRNQLHESERILNQISTGFTNLTAFAKKFPKQKHFQSELFDN